MKSTRIPSALAAILTLAVGTAQAGTITGTIVYEGNVPNLPSITAAGDPICAMHHQDGVPNEVLVLGENKELANVFVHITSGPVEGDHPVPQEPFIVDQKGCMYSPHVFAVRVGQPVRVLNPDGTLHNVHVVPKINAEVNVAMPKFRKEMDHVFDKAEAEPFPFKCDVHPWMAAYCAVLDHPFFDVTETDGKFEIKDLKPGTYEITAWHEKLPARTETVTIAEGDEKTIDFAFSIPTQ